MTTSRAGSRMSAALLSARVFTYPGLVQHTPQETRGWHALCCRAFSNHSILGAKQGGRSLGIRSSRDHNSDSGAANDTLRKAVMEDVAIPGKYQKYFKPDKRTVRKAENLALVDRSRSLKRVAVARSEGTTGDTDAATSSGARGFENVAWRALELAYARSVLPHPYFHRDYLDITEIKLQPDRKTFQLWYRPKPHEGVTEEQIAEAVVKHAAAFKAILARHARSSTSSRLVFQMARKSDRKANMADIWTRLEQEVRVEEDGSLAEESSMDAPPKK